MANDAVYIRLTWIFSQEELLFILNLIQTQQLVAAGKASFTLLLG